MKKEILVLAVMILMVSCKTSNLTTDNTSKKITLFNGNDLSGWTSYGGGKWYIADRQLVCENGPDKAFGYLVTDKSYKNFELTLEFKQEINGNGGVFVHATVDGSKAKGWQVEIGPPGHSTGGVHESDNGWLIKPNLEKDKALKEGEWNQMRIRLEGDKLISWLNNTQMATISSKKIGASAGIIALQVHGDKPTKIRWRNLQLTGL